VRTDDDTWDITTSVGSTAALVAAARAAETDSTTPLIRDPYARMLVEGEGSGMWQPILDGSLANRLTAADPEAGAIFTYMQSYQAVRTHFFDVFFAESAAVGIRQFVILASGLDSRAYRLDWPAGADVYEIDLPKVLEYKEKTLAAHGAQPSVACHEVPVDLRQDWPAALKQQGFDPAMPTAWLAEGLLMYLPARAQDRLLELITESSAPGSRVAAEAVPYSDKERRDEMRQRFTYLADELGLAHILFGFVSDIAGLTFEDPDRADVAEWLDAHGWRTHTLPVTEEIRRLDRGIDVLMADESKSLVDFVVGERRYGDQ